MAKGDGYKKDWRCPECGNYNPGHRDRCTEGSCLFLRNKVPDDYPMPTFEELAAQEDAEAVADEEESERYQEAMRKRRRRPI